MPRHKEFDRQVVLDRAVDVFWERGYESTTVQELVDAMGIQRGSLYNEFGDKRSLFLAALERYEELQVERVVQRLRGPGPVRNSIRGVFEDAMRGEAGCAGRRGCMATNTTVEMGPLDPELAARATAMLRRVEEAFRDAVRSAQARGEMGAEVDARALARFLTSSLQGIRVVTRAGATPAEVRDVVEVTLRALE